MRTAKMSGVFDTAVLRRKKAPIAMTNLPASTAEATVMPEKTRGTRKHDSV
jgi:hypothetical protein